MPFETYNPDRRYEMMAAILPGENENKPDAEQVIEDLQEVLKLCYTYSAQPEPKEFSAADLGAAIVDYLFASWVCREHDFQNYAKKYWGYESIEETPEPQDTLAGLEEPH